MIVKQIALAEAVPFPQSSYGAGGYTAMRNTWPLRNKEGQLNKRQFVALLIRRELCLLRKLIPAANMLFPEITTFLESLPNPGNEVTRLAKWNQLAGNLKKEAFNSALSFICTHNARRSVLSQCLAAALAHQHHYTSMRFYSGGAEVTRVHPNTITALEQIGFRLISTEGAAENPIYHLAFSDQAAPLRLFSKEFDHPENQKPYHAILVCSKGDAACPFIPDAASRVLLPFDDPGEYDGTAKAHKAYRYTAEVIASELNYLFQTISR